MFELNSISIYQVCLVNSRCLCEKCLNVKEFYLYKCQVGLDSSRYLGETRLRVSMYTYHVCLGISRFFVGEPINIEAIVRACIRTKFA